MTRAPAVAVLGPRGSYSEQAARKWRPGASLAYQPTPAHVFRAVERGRALVGVVPIENSVAGPVDVTLDLLRESDVSIVAEIALPIRHCLASKGPLKSVRAVASNAMALAQCRRFLERTLPDARAVPVPSTAEAARRASRRPTLAAVASEEAARTYGLRILRRNIQDYRSNATRFIALGRERPAPTRRDKTSLLISLAKDRPGFLHEVLGVFAARRINLTKVESRPTKRKLGEYVFYLDCEGHAGAPPVREALAALRRIAEFRVLGSYPRA
jgi:prephenate dehydratase